MTRLADAVLPLIRTRTELYRWSAVNDGVAGIGMPVGIRAQASRKLMAGSQLDPL